MTKVTILHESPNVRAVVYEDGYGTGQISVRAMTTTDSPFRGHMVDVMLVGSAQSPARWGDVRINGAVTLPVLAELAVALAAVAEWSKTHPGAGIETSTVGDLHTGCSKGGRWQHAGDSMGLIDRCDGCGAERA